MEPLCGVPGGRLIWLLCGVAFAFGCNGDEGDTAETGFQVEMIASANLGATDRVRLVAKREGGATDAGAEGGRVLADNQLDVNLADGAARVPPAALPPGGGTLYLHVVALLEGEVVGVGDAALGDGTTGRFEITVAPFAAACDVDGDTWLDCDNSADSCCASIPDRDRPQLGDCEDDQADVNTRFADAGDAKRRSASATHPFALTERADDYLQCENGIDDDCSGGDVRCDPEVDADGDGVSVRDDCNDADDTIFAGAYDEPGDGIDQDCNGRDGEGTDADGDGWLGDDPEAERVDCADDDPLRNPGAGEVPCDGIDQDCDGVDTCVVDGTDLDGDGFGDDVDCDDAEAGAFPGGQERCGDGIDQDCDGADLPCAEGDEDRDGFGEDDCDPADGSVYPGAPERCGDGIDQDCDGDDQVCEPALDRDGDGFLVPTDCDDSRGVVNPAAVEACDLIDNDCDGLVDEGDPRTDEGGVVRDAECGSNEGLCQRGPLVCSREGEGADVRAAFVCLAVEPGEEICDFIDNDCDGVVDGIVESCFDAEVLVVQGACQEGERTCTDGTWSECVGQVLPTDELCDAADNDCDGLVDESLEGGGDLVDACFDGPDENRERGACLDGDRRCVDGVFEACLGQILPTSEACDLQDNDCDAVVDEETDEACYDFDPQTEGVGQCTAGVRACIDGVPGECAGQVGPEPEVCDGVDNDCNQRVDDVPNEARVCFDGPPEKAGVGTCRSGLRVCQGGAFSDCDGQVLPNEQELCDGRDDDCDEAIDEDFDLLTDPLHCGRCGNACGPEETCCSGRCERLDTPANCGACGRSCDRVADRCEVGEDGVASCRCGENEACPERQACVNGECACDRDEDCGDDQLCCDGRCEDTDPETQCAACGDGGCDPEVANTCSDRTCQCGDNPACEFETVCSDIGGEEFACTGCRDERPTERCAPGTICCNQICVAVRPSRQCEACDEACDLVAADSCVDRIEDGVRVTRCECGDEGRACFGERPYCVEGRCVECRDDDVDCENNDDGSRNQCVNRICRRCDPADHAGCGGNQLCCGFACEATGPAGNQQCEVCDTACDVAATNVCAGRNCRCGGGAPCDGDTPLCDDARGTCVQCLRDADCAGHPNGGQCVNNTCEACDPNTNDGCGGNQLCCSAGGDDFRCEATGPGNGQQCEACDVACVVLETNRCAGRNCRCGNGAPCDEPNPVCDDEAGTCVECTTDVHCNGRPGGGQCVDNICRPCDPGDHAGCRGDQLCCDFQCENTSNDTQCTACEQSCGPEADRCTNRGCACGVGAACGGGTPFCVDEGCVECRGNGDCANNELCCGGTCEPTGAGNNDQCERCDQSCNPLSTNVCTNRDCRCGNNAECGGDTRVCADGRGVCVQCLVDGNCGPFPGRGQCYQENCEECDPSNHDGCNESGAEPICGLNATCRTCTGDGECQQRPGLADECVTGRCRRCDPADNAGCGGETPTCNDNYQCVPCENDQDCLGAQCVGGSCVGCDPGDDAPCAGNSPICDPNSLECRSCQNDGECRDRPGAEDQCIADIGACRECDPADNAGCAADELCCNFACIPTGGAPGESCEACGESCDQEETSQCNDRSCGCGDGPPCAGAAGVCDDARGVCVQCVNDGDCAGLAGATQCVDFQCVSCDPADHAGCGPQELCCIDGGSPECQATGDGNNDQCEACGVACDQVSTNACNDRTCECGDDAECGGALGFCRDGVGQCVECLNDGGCDNGEQCVDFQCERCDPNNHAGCGNNQLCCADGNGGFECQGTGAGANDQCEACGVACDEATSNRCSQRDCRCGGAANSECDAPEPFCDDPNDTCVECLNDGQCGGRQCVANECQACDPADHAGCGANELCCADGNGGFECTPTGPGGAEQCEACGVACDQGTTNDCSARSCGCGNGNACGGGTPICDDNSGQCVECLGDADCNGGQCVNNACEVCDPADHAGCGNNQLCCQQGNAFECQGTGPGAGGQCEACGVACDQPTTNQCSARQCGCGAGPACAGGSPLCDDGLGQCVECLDDGACGDPGAPECFEGICGVCDPTDHAGCAADELCCSDGNGGWECQATDVDSQCAECGVACGDAGDACGDRECTCGPGADVCAGASPLCDDQGACVGCRDDDDCPNGECVNGACEVCDPANHDGCGAEQLCCGDAQNGYACEATGIGSQCTACGVACGDGSADACSGRTCECGGNAECGGGTPYCDPGGGCVECLVDADCGAEELCCDGVCSATDPAVQCEACGTPCADQSDACAGRACVEP
ncbi:MAG: hypothetical protein ACYTF3_00040 [Planctomycetota bacterium]|jgi:hypothetical protein